jgi:hypothetical protein
VGAVEVDGRPERIWLWTTPAVLAADAGGPWLDPALIAPVPNADTASA